MFVEVNPVVNVAGKQVWRLRSNPLGEVFNKPWYIAQSLAGPMNMVATGVSLWAAPNLFVSPHVAYQSTSVFPRVAEVLFGNLERLEAGEPLVNEIFRG